MEDKTLKKSLAWLQDIVKGAIGHGLEPRTLGGLGVIQAQKGFIRCDLIVPSPASDVDGNWHVGAIATLIDIVGAVAIYSVAQRVITSVDFSVSYYSTAKIQEHVEIEAKVVANTGSLTQVMVEVRRKGNGELIALGKLWMASNKLAVSERRKKFVCSDLSHHLAHILLIEWSGMHFLLGIICGKGSVLEIRFVWFVSKSSSLFSICYCCTSGGKGCGWLLFWFKNLLRVAGKEYDNVMSNMQVRRGSGVKLVSGEPWELMDGIERESKSISAIVTETLMLGLIMRKSFKLIHRAATLLVKAADRVATHFREGMCPNGWQRPPPSSLVFVLSRDRLPAPP
ncbi:hypothetical protein DITRI_Ditri02bG0091400 [Diplodiscus trichospermus]